MSELKRKADDEIALVELFEIFWNGKLFILIVTSLAAIIGFSYAQFIKPTYVPNYKITEHLAYTLTSTRSDHATKLGFNIDPTWTMKDAQLKQTEQKKPVAFVSELNKLNDIFTSEVL